MEKKSGFGKFLAGAAIGAGLGVLFAPKSGKETRKDLKEMFDELVRKAKDIDIDEVRENVENKVEEIKAELADLDKEKGTPVLESLASSARNKAIDVTKEVLNRLEATK